MMGGLDPLTSVISATGLSYISITPGLAGDVIRAAGEATWDAGLIALKVSKNISRAFGLGSRVATVDTVTVTRDSVTVGEDIAKLVEEVEETVAEVESILQSATKARDAVAEEEAQIAEVGRLAEDARIAEIEYLLEGARIEKEAKAAEKEFLAEEARIAEEETQAEIARIEEEDRLEAEARIAEDEQEFLAEEARLAEEETLAEIARLEEEERLEEEKMANIAEEERLAEYARLAKEAKLAEEEDEFIDDEEWEASIQLAEGLSPDLNGKKGEWNAARQLAKDLVDEPEDEPIDFNAPGLSDEARMDLIGKAARAAVEKFEAAKQQEDDVELLAKMSRNEMKSILQKKGGISGLSVDPIPNLSVSASSDDDDGAEEEEDSDYEKMTVVVLKGVLRSRGLKVAGKKIDLIERLRADDV